MNFSLVNEIILAIVLGVTQGVTEFLPISSTAHIRILSGALAGGRDVGLVATNIMQFGTILAVFSYFRKDLAKYFKRFQEVFLNTYSEEFNSFWQNLKIWWNYPSTEEIEKDPALDKDLKEKEARLNFQTDVEIGQIFISTIPILISGLVLYSFVSSNRDLATIASFIIAGSIIMFFSEWTHQKALDYPKTRIMGVGEVILIGLFQSLAIFPGMSRSGTTISGALFLGRDRAKSVRFSFLLSIPAILIAGLSDLFKLVRTIFTEGGVSLLPDNSNWNAETISLSLISIIIAFALAYFTGLASLKWLMSYLSKNSFKWFIVYRLLLAGIILFFVFR